MRIQFFMNSNPHKTAGHRRPTRVLAASLALTATTLGVVGCDRAAAGTLEGSHLQLPVSGGTAVVDTDSLAVTAHTGGGRQLVLSDGAAGGLGKPGPVTQTADGARWSYPDKGLQVTASSERGRLRIKLRSDRDGSVDWPVTGTDRAASAVQVPRGEGLDIPVRDAFWNASPEKGGLAGSTVDMGEALSLPLWGYSMGGAGGGSGVSYLTPTDLGTSLRFASAGGRLRTTAQHAFDAGEGTRDYEVSFALTDGNPVAPAADYRSYLAQHGRLGSLRKKIRQNPATEKLLGAFHAYVWGEARTAPGVEALKKLGVDRMWLGYDSGPDPMKGPAVRAAKKAGYLVGPYDTFANGQDPEKADSPTSVWPDRVYPDFCVRRADGTPQPGFGKRGCYLSSRAFEKAEPAKHYLADRTRTMVANGADSYFLDVDATGELFRDHGKGHEMTKAGDRASRLARMVRLSKNLVLGSEGAQAWANKVLAYNHGSGTPVDDGLWALERDKKTWGGYAPEKAPGAFFKPVRLPARMATAMYDPKYRAPLYETALHGSLVNVERWELSYQKLPAQKTTRALLAMLYNTPLNFVLDGPTLQKDGPQLAALQKFFSPLHRAAGTQQLTSFRWLTADRSVQRTVFGKGALTVTANFGSKAHGGLPGGCVDAELATDRQPRRLCPAQLNG
ncbi:Glycosyl hydrolases related to GH101 family, GHL1-GHL3 [Streptomyces sp. 2224.1]|nr:glycosyl hydrolase family 101 [Streptomyces sp. 2321.6]SDR50487.1 Glycosyl hydrolases related to GH101 family, GHL1-GHL3 [Streptomyces sp. KS_16]SEC51241.1 Glycosyl hydrolases related to GH101 family, GHL1-GHL3 [Streptomyces sp. 2133.1]SEC52803.1 Glycosyl hydrolases related to GH101 family, GHL1-GHL3 [Streptomyces sp. 2224.1]SNC67984.1 Glycosyl hydrolases related to GH101 family, GHL1-GHL3 [Streptomyces sp. 2114.4]